jgi:hypothetical protein
VGGAERAAEGQRVKVRGTGSGRYREGEGEEEKKGEEQKSGKSRIIDRQNDEKRKPTWIEKMKIVKTKNHIHSNHKCI